MGTQYHCASRVLEKVPWGALVPIAFPPRITTICNRSNSILTGSTQFNRRTPWKAIRKRTGLLGQSIMVLLGERRSLVGQSCPQHSHQRRTISHQWKLAEDNTNSASRIKRRSSVGRPRPQSSTPVETIPLMVNMDSKLLWSALAHVQLSCINGWGSTT